MTGGGGIFGDFNNGAGAVFWAVGRVLWDGRVLRLLPWGSGLALPMWTPLVCPLSQALLGGAEMLSCVLGSLQR